MSRMTKRKSDDPTTLPEPPSKRLRSSTLPPLPPITPELEQYVFTHPSAASSKSNNNDTSETAAIHYDRLEFLGDAHLQLIATTTIYTKYPTANAGRMAQIRQQLVQNETLCQYAQAYGFDKRLKININLGSSSTSTPTSTTSNKSNNKGKFSLTKVYGDVFEAYIGAITLSSFPSSSSSPAQTPPTDPHLPGIQTATSFLQHLWEPLWPSLLLKFPPSLAGQKETLASKIMVPGVRIDYVEEKKPIVHMGKGVETFFVGVYLTGWGYTNQHLGSGKGMSKVQAGQGAALSALTREALIEELAAKKAEWVWRKEVERAETAAGAEAAEASGKHVREKAEKDKEKSPVYR